MSCFPIELFLLRNDLLEMMPFSFWARGSACGVAKCESAVCWLYTMTTSGPRVSRLYLGTLLKADTGTVHFSAMIFGVSSGKGDVG